MSFCQLANNAATDRGTSFCIKGENKDCPYRFAGDEQVNVSPTRTLKSASKVCDATDEVVVTRQMQMGEWAKSSVVGKNSVPNEAEGHEWSRNVDNGVSDLVHFASPPMFLILCLFYCLLTTHRATGLKATTRRTTEPAFLSSSTSTTDCIPKKKANDSSRPNVVGFPAEKRCNALFQPEKDVLTFAAQRARSGGSAEDGDQARDGKEIYF
ncbi:hypothetical protein CDD82_5532 [Ophiocordyceps australis]|uniref:Uncharacterized protein n=1 Tax=Ophiocordyceps australis TaxID=1399860 RepID=A0A2C5Z1X0_9HYPO|nr:hypothetical protein CDD82_5532 [Ophiocordyceps australis]